MAGTYYASGASAPTIVEELLVQAESRVLLGNANLYGSLETESATYLAYTASIGLASGASVDLGTLASLGFSHVPTYEPVESANIQDASIWNMSGEETSVSVGLRQFDMAVLQLALGSGIRRDFASDTETLLTFGGKCTMDTRPLCIEAANAACNAPTSEDVQAGITAIIITLYDVISTSGLNWDTMDAKAINELAIEFQARPVLAHDRGNRLGNMYCY